MFYDTHAHFDDEAFAQDREELLQEIHRQGISLINNIGCDRESSLASVALAEQYPFIYAVVGHWPGYTGSMTEADLDLYRDLCRREKVVAIGEIGLDYHYEDTPRDIQKYWFDRQLALADQVSKPVVVHEREAHGDGMEIVKKWADKVPGVFHCFSGSGEMAKELVKLGWYVSFTGVITFKNARRSLEAVAAVPMDRIMIETDAPYLAPVPYRGKRNHSGYVPKVAEKIAEIKGLTTEEVAAITMENGKRFFRIPD
jgi:TatD DNase family protein